MGKGCGAMAKLDRRNYANMAKISEIWEVGPFMILGKLCDFIHSYLFKSEGKDEGTGNVKSAQRLSVSALFIRLILLATLKSMVRSPTSTMRPPNISGLI